MILSHLSRLHPFISEEGKALQTSLTQNGQSKNFANGLDLNLISLLDSSFPIFSSFLFLINEREEEKEDKIMDVAIARVVHESS